LSAAYFVFMRWSVYITPNVGVMVMQKSVNKSSIANHSKKKLN